jgi:hypothetical protein
LIRTVLRLEILTFANVGLESINELIRNRLDFLVPLAEDIRSKALTNSDWRLTPMGY